MERLKAERGRSNWEIWDVFWGWGVRDRRGTHGGILRKGYLRNRKDTRGRRILGRTIFEEYKGYLGKKDT